MKVLIIGGGGREHALAWKVAQSDYVEQVVVAPGNAGTAGEKKIENVDICADNIDALADFAADRRIDLTIVGAETPLVMGVVNLFTERGLKCFGPTKAAAQFEGSKIFAKKFLQQYEIPTAAYCSFTDTDAAIAYCQTSDFPLVIKADGLAAGKGVVIAESRRQAETAIIDMLSEGRYGDAGRRVVIEEFLQGEEASFICMVDGRSILPMATSQDHKSAYDKDTGPNTGGMGACSPAPIVDAAMHEKIMEMVMCPTVNGMVNEGLQYTGFLYAGLMIGTDGVPKVLEFNCRFGDPEAQPIMLRMRSDLVAHCLAAIDGKLDGECAKWDDRYALGVVMASAGYPGKPVLGSAIEGLDRDFTPQKVFHAGTTLVDGQIVTTGGRVICATATGQTIHAAQNAAYQMVKQVHWDGSWYRTDIGHRAGLREKAESK